MSEKIKTTMEMTYDEFDRWAAEVVLDGLLSNGIKGLRSALNLVIGQEAMIFSRNGGFQKATK